MKLSGKIFSGGLLLAYVAVSFIALSNCSKKNDFSAYDQLRSSNPVLLDSTLIGISQKEGNYFLRAQVNTGSSIKYFAELKCSKVIADLYSRTKSNYAYVAAKITRIDDLSLVAEADSLDGKSAQINLGKSILLGGECLALAEIPSSLNAD
jgi:hypothetical protein